jgi:hypothetical protein
MWLCHTEPSKQPISYSPITPSNRDRFRAQVIRFSWLSWVFPHDTGGLLVPTIICFSSTSAPYLFYICLWKYMFSYLFLLPHKNIKTNVAALSSVYFRSVFIPTFSILGGERRWTKDRVWDSERKATGSHCICRPKTRNRPMRQLPTYGKCPQLTRRRLHLQCTFHQFCVLVQIQFYVL